MANITGTHASETLNGTDGLDTIRGLGGSDRISGLGGADTISGGDGWMGLTDRRINNPRRDSAELFNQDGGMVGKPPLPGAPAPAAAE
ncbi:hypothetical protein [Mesorhizobium sp. WSM2239]|uniref:Calcium-binding protein n=2 Tax=unclassified Mesorhizobium TaxID=325217 RepID=A0AAU8D5J7_9HYPH